MDRLPESIQTARLILRRWEEGDCDQLGHLINSNIEHLRPWMRWAGVEPLTSDARREALRYDEQVWASGGTAKYGMWLEGIAVGGCDLMTGGNGSVLEIGYWLGEAYVGKGYASEAAAALLEVAFGVEGVEAVRIWHDVANRRSRKVPKRLGFRFRWGQVRKAKRALAPREVGVDCMWELQRGDWLGKRGFSSSDVRASLARHADGEI